MPITVGGDVAGWKAARGVYRQARKTAGATYRQKVREAVGDKNLTKAERTAKRKEAFAGYQTTRKTALGAFNSTKPKLTYALNISGDVTRTTDRNTPGMREGFTGRGTPIPKGAPNVALRGGVRPAMPSSNPNLPGGTTARGSVIPAGYANRALAYPKAKRGKRGGITGTVGRYAGPA